MTRNKEMNVMKRERKNNIDFSEVRWYNENMITGYGVAW